MFICPAPSRPTTRRRCRRSTSCFSPSSSGTTEDAAEAIRPLVAHGGVVVPFQNGVDSIERIGAIVGAERVMGGVAQIAATIAEPGVIGHTGTMARLRFGPVLAAQQPVAEALLAACSGSGIDAELVGDIRRVLWEKFVFLAAFSGLTSVARQPIGVLRADAEMRNTLEAAMREAWAVGRAQGVALADDLVAQLMRFADGLPAEMKSSMLNDLVAGNRLEAPWLCGAVARMATAAGVACAGPLDALRGAQALLRRRVTLTPFPETDPCASCSSGSSMRWRCWHSPTCFRG